MVLGEILESKSGVTVIRAYFPQIFTMKVISDNVTISESVNYLHLHKNVANVMTSLLPTTY